MGVTQRRGDEAGKTKKPASADLAETSVRVIGNELRDMRMGAGRALKDIAAELRIRADHLRAIEEGRYELLPGPPYAAGFIRSYANHLGFDGSEIVAHYREETSARDPSSRLVFLEPVNEGRMPAAPIVIVSALAGVLILMAWIVFSRGDQVPFVHVVELPERLALLVDGGAGTEASTGVAATLDQAAEQNAASAISLTEAESATDSLPAGEDENTAPQTPPENDEALIESRAQPSGAAQAAAFGIGSRITIRARNDAWTLVRVTGQEPLFEGVLRAGETIRVPNHKGLLISTGNAGGLEIAVDGTAVAALGPVGGVMRGVPLDADVLLSEPPTGLD